MSAPVVERLSGNQVAQHAHELAALRIAVFRAFPYLYEGNFDYELRYLSRYAQAPGSQLVIARAGQRVVGASTCTPLLGQSEDVVNPLRSAGYDPACVFYFGESVLLPEYRGQRVGHAFFDQREQAAREGGYSVLAFCAVSRPVDHPQRPVDYVAHDAFWGKRGFVRRPQITARFSWRDVGDDQETAKTMVFWTRELGS